MPVEALRLPPQSVQAEQAVLGGLMLAPGAFDRVAGTLSERDFYRHDHQLIWRAIAELAEQRQPFDAVTIGDWFETQGLAGHVDNGSYLIELASNTPSAANITAYADIVRDKATLRSLIEVGTGIVNDGFQPEGREVSSIVADARAKVSAIASGKRQALKDVNDGLSEMVNGMQERLEAGDMMGTSYGLPAMDEMTGGKQPGDLIIIAARPSMGKTTLALQGGLAAGRPLMFSFETKADRLLARMTAHVGRFPLRWILCPRDAPDHAFSMISAAARQVKQRLFAAIYDGARLNVSQLRETALREHDRSPVREIIIDHFGHLRREGRQRADQEQGEDMKELKALAREMNVPVIVLMQLNRGVESRADKRPVLSDLRECGAAEEDADVVAMIYRDAYYNPTSPIREYAEIFLRKNRDGDPGEVWAKPCLPEMRFDEAEPQQRPYSGAGGYGSGTGGQAGIGARTQPTRVSQIGGAS